MSKVVNPLTMEEDKDGISLDSCLFEDQRDEKVEPLSDEELDKLLAEKALEADNDVTAQAVLQYPKYFAHRFIPSPNQHGNGNRRPTHVTIHTIQGSYEGCISWFQQKKSYVSAHYVVSFEGHTTQMVYENFIAWHVGNHNGYTVGIEHEGYAHDGVPPTSAMFHNSAKLTAGICLRWGIPITRDRIKGHREYSGQTHTDPGNEWDMNKYVNLVRQYAKKQAATPEKTPSNDKPQKPERVMFVYHKNALASTKNSAHAAAYALKSVGVRADSYSDGKNANYAAGLALDGRLGQNVLVVQGTMAMLLFKAANKENFTHGGEWFHPDKSDVWDARRNVVQQTRWNISRLCERAGADKGKALMTFDNVYGNLMGKA